MKKPAKKGADFKSSISAMMGSANQNADDRFSIAAEVTARQPTGVAALQSDVPAYEARHHTEAERSVVDVEIALVSDNPFNARQNYSEAIVKERATSLAKDGQLQPAPACKDPNAPGRFILIGGHYRKRGLLALGKKTIQLKLLSAPTQMDLYRLSYSENNEREAGTPLDNAMAWQNLLDKGVAANDEAISSAIGVPRSTIAKHRQILNLPAQVLEVLRERPERFTLTTAYELQTLTKLLPPGEVMALAKQVASEEGLSSRELQAIKNRLESPKQRKPKEMSRQFKITAPDGAPLGQIKDWDTGRVELDVKISDPAVRESLVLELRKRFGID